MKATYEEKREPSSPKQLLQGELVELVQMDIKVTCMGCILCPNDYEDVMQLTLQCSSRLECSWFINMVGV